MKNLYNTDILMYFFPDLASIYFKKSMLVWLASGKRLNIVSPFILTATYIIWTLSFLTLKDQFYLWEWSKSCLVFYITVTVKRLDFFNSYTMAAPLFYFGYKQIYSNGFICFCTLHIFFCSTKLGNKWKVVHLVWQARI